MIANTLSIAGSDPSGGAGIQADLKAFAACGTYGMAVITALTVQNTQGVRGVHLVPPAFVAAQIAAIFDDIRVDAVKIGMIASAGIAEAVASGLADRPDIPIVLDPVMVAKGGARLLDPEAVAVLQDHLLPLATLLTPNLPEAAALLGCAPATTRTGMLEQALDLCALGSKAVLVKGGHLEGPESPDVFVTRTSHTWLEAARHPTANTHGTGCTLSSAIAAELAKGASGIAAVQVAKSYLTGAVRSAGKLTVGSGHGPTNHFHSLWSQDPPIVST